VELKSIVQEVAQLQVPGLEKRLLFLSTMAFLAPLLGLLGTVTGMIDAFTLVQAKAGTATAADLSSGIWEALIATAAGLCVAIPTHAAHNLLVARVNHFVNDMERAGIEIVQALTSKAVLVDYDPLPGDAPGKAPKGAGEGSGA
jgi:biopolymer transport protein ExbB